MNEIRMYVERLFQGKTLTNDVIELKEEIYGNLVARYEDYLAEGMSETDALAKTKVSMTSVDDVLAGDADATKDETAKLTSAATTEPVATASRAANTGLPVNPVAEGSAAAPMSPVPVSSSKKKWIIVAVASVLVLGGIALGMAVMDELADAHEERIEEQRERRQGTDSASVSINEGGISVKNGDDEVTIDSDGTIRLEGDLADELLTEVVNDGSDELRPYIDTDLSNATVVAQAIRALPMGEWAANVDITRGNGVLTLSYEKLPEFDGDSIDAALVYDATALFCLIPKMNELHVAVSEADDGPNDRDYYVFSRDVMEGQAGYGVALNSDMLNESNWNGQIKRDHLYKANFVDRIIDQAEAE